MVYPCGSVTRTIEVRRVGTLNERARRQPSSAACYVLQSQGYSDTGLKTCKDRPEQCLLGAPTTPFGDTCAGRPLPESFVPATGERRRYASCAVVDLSGHGTQPIWLSLLLSLL